MDTHYGVIVSIGVAGLAVLLTMLGVLVKAVTKWAVLTVKVTAIEKMVHDLTRELVTAVTKDNDHEIRLRLLEETRSALRHQGSE